MRGSTVIDMGSKIKKFNALKFHTEHSATHEHVEVVLAVHEIVSSVCIKLWLVITEVQNATRKQRESQEVSWRWKWRWAFADG